MLVSQLENDCICRPQSEWLYIFYLFGQVCRVRSKFTHQITNRCFIKNNDQAEWPAEYRLLNEMHLTHMLTQRMLSQMFIIDSFLNE